VRRKNLYSICLFLVFGGSLFGQNTNIIGKKERRTKNPKQSETVVLTKKLAQSITKNANTDSEKVYAIYYWIATNISYDNELRLNTDLQKRIYVSEENIIKNALERRKALCGGFAFLFKDLCKNVGVSAEVVHGFTKNYSSKIKDTKSPSHTWNAVKLNGRWELLDITWAVADGTPKNPDSFWYLTNPSDFIYSHYPEDPTWILLPTAISLAEFRSHPKQ